MSTIMKNDRAYAGSYVNKNMELTLAEYLELEQNGQVHPDITYFITDANEELAKNIAYDNIDTGLEATDMQDAIDELNSDLGEVSSNLGEVSSNLGKIDYNFENIETITALGIKFQKNGKHVNVYGFLTGLATTTDVNLGAIENCIPINAYAVIPLYSSTTPYTNVGTMWISNIGIVTLYKPASTTSLYVSGSYMCTNLVDIPTITSLTGTQSVSFMGGGSDSVSYTVTFPKAFSSIPTVTLSPVWTSNGGWVDYVQAKNVTTTGFTLFVQSLGGASSGKGINGKVSWVASV